MVRNAIHCASGSSALRHIYSSATRNPTTVALIWSPSANALIFRSTKIAKPLTTATRVAITVVMAGRITNFFQTILAHGQLRKR